MHLSVKVFNVIASVRHTHFAFRWAGHTAVTLRGCKIPQLSATYVSYAGSTRTNKARLEIYL